ncbi:MAG: hypothetical protein AB7Q17_14555 [Phycisphaerae bacterium]
MTRHIVHRALRLALTAAAAGYVLGGCATSGQLQDFARTQFVSTISSIVGQFVSLAVRAGGA